MPEKIVCIDQSIAERIIKLFAEFGKMDLKVDLLVELSEIEDALALALPEDSPLYPSGKREVCLIMTNLTSLPVKKGTPKIPSNVAVWLCPVCYDLNKISRKTCRCGHKRQKKGNFNQFGN